MVFVYSDLLAIASELAQYSSQLVFHHEVLINTNAKPVEMTIEL